MELAVYLPHDYNSENMFPVLVIPDADPLLGILQTTSFLLAEEGTAQTAILVGLPFGDNASTISENRTYYLLPDSVGTVDYYGMQMPLNNGGGASELARFLAEQVLPTVQQRYNVDPNRIGLAGFSMGGLYAAWHLVTYPGQFTDFLIVAPPLAAPMIGAEFARVSERALNAEFERATRVYISYAEHDLEMVKSGAAWWIDEWEKVVHENLRFRSEMVPDLRHDGGALPALVSGYKFLYGK